MEYPPVGTLWTKLCLQEYTRVMAWIPTEICSSPGWSKDGRNPTFPLEERLPSKAASPRERGSVGVLGACRQSPRS